MQSNSMWQFKLSALFIFALAVLFYAFFMHAKHDPALSVVNAFVDDPYDAVGSFGIQAAVFLGILCLFRAFRPPRSGMARNTQDQFLFRAQLAAVLSVAVTLAADAVAMLRHPFLWIGSSAGFRLLALLAGMAILTAALGAWIWHAAREMEIPPASPAWSKALAVSALTLLVLLLYPESFRHRLIGVLFTALVGTVVLFASMWAWMVALLPQRQGNAPAEPVNASRSLSRKKYAWAIVILTGILIGLFFVAGEASEGTGIPHGRLALVVSVYIGLETIGLMIGYGFLGKPLGLFRKFSEGHGVLMGQNDHVSTCHISWPAVIPFRLILNAFFSTRVAASVNP